MRNCLFAVFIFVVAISCSKGDHASRPPAVTTDSVTNITETSARIYGTIHEGERGAVYRRGVRWGYSLDVFSNGAYATDGSPGSFWVDVTGLEPQTNYYVFAFMEDAAGIIPSAGEVRPFITK